MNERRRPHRRGRGPRPFGPPADPLADAAAEPNPYRDAAVDEVEVAAPSETITPVTESVREPDTDSVTASFGGDANANEESAPPRPPDESPPAPAASNPAAAP